MRDPNDAWFVRLPDGHVVRAKTTASVRRHIGSGRIPVDSWVRRSPEEDWVTLEWAVEFTDLVTKKNKDAGERGGNRETPLPPSARVHDPRSGQDLRTVGVRGLVDELMTALDSSLNRRKLMIACLAGLLGGATLVAEGMFGPWYADLPAPILRYVAVGIVLLIVAGIATALLTQMTFVELSRLRPARWREATTRLGSSSVRLIFAQLLVGGGVLAVTYLVSGVPEWSTEEVPSLWPALATVLSLVLEVLLWPVLGLSLLLGPIIVVEEYSIPRAIVQWAGLLRRNLSRAFLYEALAVALGAIMTLPFLVPVVVAGRLAQNNQAFAELTWATLCFLTGLALTPFIGYLVVANVFIYLNLRYELSVGPRE